MKTQNTTVRPNLVSKTVFATATVLAVGCATSARSIDLCNRFTFGHHAGDWEHQDIGNGFISFTSFSDLTSFENVPTSRSDLLVVECQTGRKLQVKLSATNGDKSSDYRAEVKTAFAQVVGGSQSFTLEALETLFDGITDGHSHVRTSSEEECGCLMAYPELRGDKTPFDIGELPT